MNIDWPRSTFRRLVTDGTAVSIALVVANAWWVIAERRGQTLDIDEAGYLSMSMSNARAWHHGGPTEWWHTIVSGPVQAPLAPAATSIIHVLTGTRAMNAFVVSMVAFAILLAVVLACTAGWPRSARLAAIVFTGGAPVLLQYGRSNNFAELAAAALAVAIWAGARSDGFGHFGPSLAWGAAIGLMTLIRTMTLAFVPGLLVAGLLPVATRRSWPRARNLLCGVALGVAIASTWYGSNLRRVLDFLQTFGYGSRAREYGTGSSLLSIRDWWQFAAVNTNAYLQLGLVVAIGACAVLTISIALGRALKSWQRGGHSAVLSRIETLLAGGSAVTMSFIVAGAGWIALMTTNPGSAFCAPLILPTALVASNGIRLVTRRRVRITCATVGVALVLPAAILSFLPIRDTVLITLHLRVPALPDTDLVIVDSRGTLRTYLDGGGIQPLDAPRAGTDEHGHRWFGASARIVDAAAQQRQPALVLFTFRHRLVNPETILVDAYTRQLAIPRVDMLSPPLPGQTVDDLIEAQVDSIAPSISMVVIATEGPDEFQPPVPPEVGIAVVKRLGFQMFDKFDLPDGREVSLWTAPNGAP